MKHVKCVSYFSPLGLLAIGLYALPIQAQPSFTTLDFPGGIDTSGLGVNNSGVVVGYFHNPDLTVHGFQYMETYIRIDFPGAIDTAATGINNNGKIVGNYSTLKTIHGFWYDQTSYFGPIDVTGAMPTYVNGINDQDQIVGSYATPFGLSGFQMQLPTMEFFDIRPILSPTDSIMMG